jgi:PAS domain S-box-containing protein
LACTLGAEHILLPKSGHHLDHHQSITGGAMDSELEKTIEDGDQRAEDVFLPGERDMQRYLPHVSDERHQAQKQLHQQLTLTRALTDSLGEGIYALDASGRVTFMNRAAERLLGWPEAELLGKDIHKAIHYRHADGSVFPASDCPLVAALRSKQVVRCNDDVFVRKDGSLLHVAYVSSPVMSEGRMTSTVLAFHDISDQHNALLRRFEFLAEAGTVLASSLEYEHTLTQFAWLIVPELADACYLDVLEEDNSIQRLAIAHRDPEKLRILQDIRSRRTLETSPWHPVSRVLRSGQSLLIPEIPENGFEELAAADPQAAASLRLLGYHSMVCVPMRARGWIVGALTMVTGESGRTYGPDDVAMAEDLGRRAGLAVDNARLLKQTQRALHQVEEIADQVLMQATQLDAVIEAIPGMVFVCDAAKRLTRVNPSGAAMLGLQPESTFSLSAGEDGEASVFSPDGLPLPEDEHPLLQALRGITRADYRCMMRRFDTGEDVQLLVSFAPIRDAVGNITGAVAVGNDVSEIYRLEKEKDEFLSIASHELKTPLTSLKILVQLTHRRLIKAGAKESEQLEGMDRSIERMERLVNDLLDVSRIQAGKLALRLEDCDLAALCRQIAQEQSAASDRPITLDLPEQPIIATADPERLGQVLTNLLSNALKYSPPGCLVSLTLHVEDGGQAHMIVRDEGAGIPPDLQEHLFERFYRVPGVQVQSGSGVGLGLGLYISREIVERHHGRIWVESSVGEGASFHVTLPLSFDAPH